MRTASVTKQFKFEAAHQIPNHFGKCANLHGHSYIFNVTIKGVIDEWMPDDSSEGMVVDFYYLKELVSPEVIDKLDHQFLNDVLPTEFLPSTAENIAYWIFDTLCDPIECKFDVTLEKVELWETASSSAIVTRDDYFASLDGDNKSGP